MTGEPRNWPTSWPPPVTRRERRPTARSPRQNTLHRSVVKLLIEDYEAGASTYELAERYNVRRNTVRDTLRRTGFDLTVKAMRAALSEE